MFDRIRRKAPAISARATPAAARGLVLLAACVGAACTTLPMPNDDEARALEKRRFDATVARDYATLEPLLAPDLRYCHSNGRCETREQFLASLRSGNLVYRRIEPIEITPRRAGPLLLIGGRARLEVESGGNPQTMELVYTDVYARRSGGWQLIAWHSSRVMP